MTLPNKPIADRFILGRNPRVVNGHVKLFKKKTTLATITACFYHRNVNHGKTAQQCPPIVPLCLLTLNYIYKTEYSAIKIKYTLIVFLQHF